MFLIIKEFILEDFFVMLPSWILVFIVCNIIGKGVRIGR